MYLSIGVILMVIETNRLILREMSFDDFDSLKAIISDTINMKYYEQPYDDTGVTRWINWNLTNNGCCPVAATSRVIARR